MKEKLEARREITPIMLQSAVSRKVKKAYSPGAAALVIYLNISSHFWDDEIGGAVPRTDKSRVGAIQLRLALVVWQALLLLARGDKNKSL